MVPDQAEVEIGRLNDYWPASIEINLAAQDGAVTLRACGPLASICWPKGPGGKITTVRAGWSKFGVVCNNWVIN